MAERAKVDGRLTCMSAPASDFSIRQTAKGATLVFMSDDAAAETASFRAAFPRAKWDPGYRHWFVSGQDAVWRLQVWVNGTARWEIVA